jgi:signal transduction histidine kinase
LCTSEDYPERHAYALIAKLQEKIAEISHCEYETEENIKAHTKKLAAELTDRYNDLAKVDKLAQATEEVESLKDELGSGIKKIMGNQETLNQMSDKA